MKRSAVNEVRLTGNLTAHPSVRNTTSGKVVCTFSIAVNRYYRGADGEQNKETDYFDVETWDKTAVACGAYIGKGREVEVRGRLKLDKWVSEDGTKRSRIKIVARSVDFLRKPKSALAAEGLEEEVEEAVAV